MGKYIRGSLAKSRKVKQRDNVRVQREMQNALAEAGLMTHMHAPIRRMIKIPINRPWRRKIEDFVPAPRPRIHTPQRRGLVHSDI